MPKAVLFDLDCTLYDRDAVYVNMLGAFKRRFAERLNPALDNWALLESLEHSDRLGSYTGGGWPYILQFQTEAGLWADPPTSEELVAFIHEHFAAALCPDPEAAALMVTLKSNGYLLGLITNGPADFQGEKLDKTGLRDFFDVIVISGNEPKPKPHPSIFARALEELGCAPEKAVYVGDSPVSDVCGARGAGMIPVWIRYYDKWPTPYTPPRYSIRRLRELPDVLADMQKNGL